MLYRKLPGCRPHAYSRNVGGSTLRVPVEVLVHGDYSRNVGGSTLRVLAEVLFNGAYLRNVGGSTLRVGSVTYDEISRTRPHRAAIRHPFVRTRTKTKYLHNAKKGL